MTKKQFQYDLQRGLGSCVLALKNMSDSEKERFQPLVLWGCSRDMAYDAQCEGCRSFYLYELIMEFADITPFLDRIEKNLIHSMHSSGWEFAQDCNLLAFFVSDRNKRAWRILTHCYDTLLQILSKKRTKKRDGLFPERDNFEYLCVSLACECFDDRERRTKLYRMIVRDLGILINANTLYDYDDFEWFQAASEDTLGKKTIQKLLYGTNVDENIKNYAHLREECLKARESERERKQKVEPQTADEVYQRLKNGEKIGQMCSLMLGRTFMKRDKKLEVLKLATYYKEEVEDEMRYNLLRLLANRDCAWACELSCLIADSQSKNSELSERAFVALRFYPKDVCVRDYAIALLQKKEHIAEAVSMLAANYEESDKELFVEAVKQIPITYENGYWHAAFYDVMDVFASGKKKPNELLLYMYRNTLCSFCREYVVREMGRRHMLTRELLEEMQYDSNSDIRKYVDKKLRVIKNNFQ